MDDVLGCGTAPEVTFLNPNVIAREHGPQKERIVSQTPLFRGELLGLRPRAHVAQHVVHHRCIPLPLSEMYHAGAPEDAHHMR